MLLLTPPLLLPLTLVLLLLLLYCYRRCCFFIVSSDGCTKQCNAKYEVRPSVSCRYIVVLYGSLKFISRSSCCLRSTLSHKALQDPDEFKKTLSRWAFESKTATRFAFWLQLLSWRLSVHPSFCWERYATHVIYKRC